MRNKRFPDFSLKIKVGKLRWERLEKECLVSGVKKVECQKIDAFELWCWRRLFFLFFLEKTLESPLNCEEIQPVHPKGNQFWVFIGRTDAEIETPVLWPPHAKS